MMAFSHQIDNSKGTKRYSPSVAYDKIARYCAFQERSHKEVRNKLYTYGLYQSEVEEAISRLIGDGFLNEERFAKAFAGGKFRIKKWGRNKIVNALEGHGVTPNCIERGLREIDQPAYLDTLSGLLKKKLSQLKEFDSFKKRGRAARYAIGKGYESELVWRLLKELV